MSEGSPSVLIVAGEASGDLYGGLLIEAMCRQGPARFVGVGGPSMRAAGLEPLGDADVMGVTGLLEVLGHFRMIWRAYRAAGRILKGDARSRPPGAAGRARGASQEDDAPDLVILIDYPDFNLRLAERARRAGVPVLYFVSPQVWAWRRGRVAQIARSVDRMLVILPFEEEFYQRAGVKVEFVGHPLLDLIRPERSREQTLRSLGLDPRLPVVAMIPGSRDNEIRAHLPAMIGAARLLLEEFRDLQFLLPVAPTLTTAEVRRLVRAAGGDAPAHRENRTSPRPVLVENDRYDAVAASDAAVVASGTATLETALMGVPMVAVYRMNPLTFAFARAISDVPHIAMPNLIAGKRLVPELLQGECRPDRIAAELRRILTDPAVSDEMRRGLAAVRSRLGRQGAIARVARVAWSMIARPQVAAR